MRKKSCAAALVAAALVLSACGEDEPADDRHLEKTRNIMSRFLENLKVVLPHTVEDDGLGEPDPDGETRRALQNLAADAAVLEKHTRRGTRGTRYLTRSLVSDTHEIVTEFDRRNFSRAGYLVRNVTANCVACHSRLPDPGDSPLAEHFLDAQTLTELEPYQLATLQIATRRFDDALSNIEKGLASKTDHPAVLLGPLTDYLTVSIRVKNDYERPVPVLRRFAERPDVWTRLRLDVEAWIEALPELQRRTRTAPGLATARSIITDGTAFGSVSTPSEGLVHMIAASAVLQQAIETGDLKGTDLAEAYYLMGIIESRIGRDYWLTQAPYFLESSIRRAPGAPFAREAYARLEEEIMMLYEGTDAERIPKDDAELLGELSALIDRAS
jgi:hypothetical protein